MTLFDGGQRSAKSTERRPRMTRRWRSTARRCWMVFREVENYMVQLKVLEDEAVVSNEAWTRRGSRCG